MSIQTQKSQPYSTDTTEYKYVQKRRSNKNAINKQHKVKQLSLFVILATLAASSYRASLRKKRIVRSASPFGRIRNASPLGNGVSVIRVCMALGLDVSTNGTIVEDNKDAMSLLKRLDIEDKELYAKFAVLTQQQQQLQGFDTYGLRQKALGEYLSNGKLQSFIAL